MGFRANFIMQNVINFMWFFQTLIAIEVIYIQTNSIGGWDKESVYLLTIVYHLANSMLKSVVVNNIMKLGEKINSGDLDSILLKPVNSLFWAATRYVNFSQMVKLAVFCVIYVVYAFRINPRLSVLELTIATLFLLVGQVGFVGFLIIWNSISFWKPRVWNIQFIGLRVNDYAAFPAEMYKGIVRNMVYILPVAALATVPYFKGVGI